MLQCTAVTKIPELDALVALATMEGGPENPPDVLTLNDHHALCELGEHDDQTGHAARLCVSGTADADLWLFWSEDTHRLDVLPPCLASAECTLFARHPEPHSPDVTDPLGDLLAEQARRDVRRVMDDMDDQGET